MEKTKRNYVGKTVFIEKYANKMGITLSEAEKQVNGFLNLQEEILLDPQVDGIQIIGFYTIRKKENKERLCNHPKTGEAIIVPASKSLKIEIGKTFKVELNK